MKPTRPLQRFHPCAWHRAAGFTLVEMAVVVTLMAIAMTMGLRLLSATRDSAAGAKPKSSKNASKSHCLPICKQTADCRVPIRLPLGWR